MEQYRHMVSWSAETAMDPAKLIGQSLTRMAEAAEELHFEIAGKIKAYIDQLSQLGKGPYRDWRTARFSMDQLAARPMC